MVILLKMVNLIEVDTTPVSLPYLSEFRLIQPLSGISVLPLPTTRSKELLLYVFRKYIRQPMSRYRSRISTTPKLTTSLSWITLWASKGYPLFGQFHTKLITPRTFPKSQIIKKLCIKLDTLIYMYIKPQNTFYFNFYSKNLCGSESCV